MTHETKTEIVRINEDNYEIDFWMAPGSNNPPERHVITKEEAAKALADFQQCLEAYVADPKSIEVIVNLRRQQWELGNLGAKHLGKGVYELPFGLTNAAAVEAIIAQDK